MEPIKTYHLILTQMPMYYC